MPAGSTYSTIATQTLTSDQASIDFTGISGSFTDIRAIINVKGASTIHMNCRIGNGSYDSGTNYSLTGIFGRLANTGPSMESESARNTNQTAIRLTPFTYVPSGNFATVQADFMNYANTTTFKSILVRAATQGGQNYSGTEACVNLWRSTSAINQMSFYMLSGNLAAGTTITLYGITAA